MIRKLKPEQYSDPYDRPHEKLQQLPLTVGDDDSQEPTTQIKVSNLRFSRRRFTFAVTAFLMGAILIIMESPYKNEFLAPGPLASSHAQILAGQGAARCAACHDTGDQTFGNWLSGIFSSNRDASACQSDLCMKCHERSLNKEFATKPHNIAPADLRKLTDRIQSVSATDVVPPPTSDSGDIQCSSCHREHHGSNDLRMLTDRQCQTCHSQKIHNFETDHPEFTSWPQSRRQKIAFDHVSHFYKHFPGKEHSFDCKMCHVDDQFQSVKLLSSYEQTCSQCHEKDILQNSEQGMQLVRLPMLDLDAIKDQALSIGQWPERAAGDFDGAVPELMRMLLYKDTAARKILDSRGEGFEFGDLDPDEPQDVGDAVALAWSIKYLLFDLATKGPSEIRNRMEFAVQRSLTETEFQSLTQGLDTNVFAVTANAWLPELSMEVPEHRRNHSGLAEMIQSQKLLRYFKDEDPGLLAENPVRELMNPADATPQSNEPENKVTKPGIGALEVPRESNDRTPDSTSSNWLTGEDEPEPLLNAPRHHDPMIDDQKRAGSNDRHKNSSRTIPEAELLAENPVRKFVSPFPPTSDQTISRSVTESGGNGTGQGSRKANVIAMKSDPRQNGNSNRTAPPKIAIPEHELLAHNPLDSIRQGALSTQDQPESSIGSLNFAHSNRQQPSSRVSNSSSRALEQEIVKEFVDKVSEAKAETEQGETFKFETVSSAGEQFVGTRATGGWYRNDALLQISYRPTGHADRLIQTVMDVVAAAPESQKNPATSAFFGKMTSSGSVGSCFRCHTIDSDDRAGHIVNWRPEYRDPRFRSFTRFSHGPHVMQPQLADCSGCHNLDRNQTNAHSFVHFDSTDAMSNFAPITKANCTSCHFRGSTNSGCTQCHNYHVGSRVPGAK